MSLNPPTPRDWLARYNPQPGDFNTYIRDTFNFLAGPPRLRVTQNAVQSGIVQNVWTTVQMQSVLEDSNAAWVSGVNNYYPAPVPGWYGITLMVQAAVPAGNMARVGYEYQINGVTIGPLEFNQQESGLNPWGWSGYDEVYLGLGDRFYPQFNHAYTASVSTSLANPSSLEIVWLNE